MRLIDADALEKVIDKGIKEPMYQHEEEDFYDGMINAENLIKEQPTIELPHWIPCSERLPEKNGDYLCSLGDDAHSIEVDTFTDDHFEIYNVIAWMPLPESYKGE